MVFPIPKYIDLNAFYTKAIDYTIAGKNKCFAWATVNFNAVCNKTSEYAVARKNQWTAWAAAKGQQAYSSAPSWPTITNFAKASVYTGFNAGKTFVWSHKEVLAGSTIITVALAIIYYIWKNSPQMPNISLESSLNFATLTIDVPKEQQHLPPDVTLIFCIDTSGSMDPDERGGAVMRALKSVLNRAQEVVNTINGAKIGIAITGFTNTSKVITPFTQLTSDTKIHSSLIQQVESLVFNGDTKILNGLEGATEQLEKVAKVSKDALHFVVLLTDGDDSIEKRQLSSIHTSIKSAPAKLFAIGIGKEHKKETLKEIANVQNGEYIDTTIGEHTIESAISKIYQQAIASFQEFELTAPQLDPSTWSVKGMNVENGKCNLGALSEGQTLQKFITIHGERLKAPLDLSTVELTLTFLDPRGIEGMLSLPWNPDTIIEPKIVSRF